MDKETACKASEILFKRKEVEAALYVLEHAKANNEKIRLEVNMKGLPTHIDISFLCDDLISAVKFELNMLEDELKKL